MDSSVITDEGMEALSNDMSNKGWKIRSAAYQKVIGLFLAEGASFISFLPLLTMIAEETSTLAQDSGVMALSTFFDNAPMHEDADLLKAWENIAGDVCSALVSSSMGTGEKTAERGEAVLMKICENCGMQFVIDALVAGVDNRRMKIPPACLKTLRNILHDFGHRAVPVHELVDKLFDPAGKCVLDSAKEPVRRAGMALFVELRRWGVETAATDASLNELQQRELDTALEQEMGQNSAPPKPLRAVRGLKDGIPSPAPSPRLAVTKSPAAATATATAAKSVPRSAVSKSTSKSPASSSSSSVSSSSPKAATPAPVAAKAAAVESAEKTPAATGRGPKSTAKKSTAQKSAVKMAIEAEAEAEADVEAPVAADTSVLSLAAPSPTQQQEEQEREKVEDVPEGAIDTDLLATGYDDLAIDATATERTAILHAIAGVLETQTQTAGKDTKLVASSKVCRAVINLCLLVLGELSAAPDAGATAKDYSMALKVLNGFASKLDPSIVSSMFTVDAIDIILSTYKEQKIVADTSFTLLALFTNLLPLEKKLLDGVTSVFATTNASPRTSAMPAHSRAGLMEFISEVVAIAAGQVPGANRGQPLLGTSLLQLAQTAVAALSDSSVRQQSLYIISSLQDLCSKATAASKDEESGKVLALIAALEATEPEKDFCIMTNKPAPAQEKKKIEPAKHKKAVAPAVVVEKKVEPAVAVEEEAIKKPAAAAAVEEEGAVFAGDYVEALSMLGVEGWGQGGSFDADMDGDKWQDKVTCIETLASAVSANASTGTIAAFVAYMSAHTGKFKTNNINLLKALVESFTNIANTVSTTFPRDSAATIVRALGDKVGDKKIGTAVVSMIGALASNAGSSSAVFSICSEKCAASKVPTLKLAYLEGILSIITNDAAATLPLMPLPVVAKLCLTESENKLPTVRGAAAELLGNIYHYIGLGQFMGLLDGGDISKNKKLIDECMAKHGLSPQIISLSSGNAGDDSKSGKGGKGSKAGGGSSGRRNLATYLPKDIVKQLVASEGKASWMERKVAMEAVIKACGDCFYLAEHSKFVDDIFRALRQKGACLADFQANNKPIAANVVAALMVALEPEAAAKSARSVIGLPLMLGLTDNKNNMRVASLNALYKVVHRSMDYTSENEGGTVACKQIMSAFLPHIVEVLSTETYTVARPIILGWLEREMDTILEGDGDAAAVEIGCCDELASPLVCTLQDKTAKVREAAKRVMIEMVSRGGVTVNAIDLCVRVLAPAAKRTLEVPLKAIYAAFGDAPAADGKEEGASTAKLISPIKRRGDAPANKAAPSSPVTKAAAAPATAAEAPAAASTTSGLLGKVRRVPAKASGGAAASKKEKEEKKEEGSGKATSPVLKKKKVVARVLPGARKISGEEKKEDLKAATSTAAAAAAAADYVSSPKPFDLRLSLSPQVDAPASAAVPTTPAAVAAMVPTGGSNKAMVAIIADTLHAFPATAAAAASGTDRGQERDIICDYVKLLHGLVKKAGDGDDEAEELQDVFVQKADSLVSALVGVLYAAFDASPGSGTADASSTHSSLVTACLATLFALLKVTDEIALSCHLNTVTACYQACLLLMSDPALSRIGNTEIGNNTTPTKGGGDSTSTSSSSSSSSDPRELGSHVIRALNIITLKMAAVVPSCTSLTAIVLTLTSLVVGGEADKAAAAAASPVGGSKAERKRADMALKLGKLRTVLAVKPTSKLLLKVLGAESKKGTPFISSTEQGQAALKKNSPLVVLLSALAGFFSSLQVNYHHSENELLFMCGKTLQLELVRALGGARVLNLLSFIGVDVKDPGAALMISLTHRFDPTSAAIIAANDPPAAPASPQRDENDRASANAKPPAAADAAAAGSGLQDIKAQISRLSLASKLDSMPVSSATFPAGVSKTTADLHERVAKLKRQILEKEGNK